MDGNPLTVAGRLFGSGIGTHARSVFAIDLGGRAERFHSMVGLDQESANHGGSVKFKVVADGQTLWQSSVMRVQDQAMSVDVDLTGRKTLTLIVEDGGDGIDYDHADWGDAVIVMASGVPMAIVPPVEKPYILTPKAGPMPRLTGPTIFGATPGRPFLFTVTATGARPMTFAAASLPPGLTLDSSTGCITGTVEKAGHYLAQVRAKNSRGEAKRSLRIVIGDQIALTPPMGWNSWNCWADSVSQEKVLKSARAMAAKLKDHGWSYVNMDDGWQGVRGGVYQGLLANKKFPNMAEMVSQIHAMGLKAGIYSTPWAQSYAGYRGSSVDSPTFNDFGVAVNETERFTGKTDFHHFGKVPMIGPDTRQWVEWGIDYLKYDWNPLDVEHVAAMSEELRKSGRDIFYSLSNSAAFNLRSDYARLSNSWRTTGDINDTWASVLGIWETQDRWHDAGGPGHWNDPDMLVVGKLGWGPAIRPTKLSPSEQYTHISLWCLLSAPLLLGCDLDQLDDFTLNLLTNDDVLDVDQDALGRDARKITTLGETEVWCKEMEDGSRAIGLFNKGDAPGEVRVNLPDAGLEGSCRVRDLWRQKELGTKSGVFSASVPTHGVVLIRAWSRSRR